MIVIGIDPDSKSHGVAIYKNGELKELHNMQLPELMTLTLNLKKECDNILFSIENTLHKKAVYRQHSSTKARPQGEIGRRLGLCQQSQIELIRFLEYYKIEYKLFKPQAGNWAKQSMKKQFEKITGWEKRSNTETRSAAFFGFIAQK